MQTRGRQRVVGHSRARSGILGTIVVCRLRVDGLNWAPPASAVAVSGSAPVAVAVAIVMVVFVVGR